LYIILCRLGGLPLHRYTHDGPLIHVDQNMTQLLIKLGIIWRFFSTVFTVLQTNENYVCVE